MKSAELTVQFFDLVDSAETELVKSNEAHAIFLAGKAAGIMEALNELGEIGCDMYSRYYNKCVLIMQIAEKKISSY